MKEHFNEAKIIIKFQMNMKQYSRYTNECMLHHEKLYRIDTIKALIGK